MLRQGSSNSLYRQSHASRTEERPRARLISKARFNAYIGAGPIGAMLCDAAEIAALGIFVTMIAFVARGLSGA